MKKSKLEEQFVLILSNETGFDLDSINLAHPLIDYISDSTTIEAMNVLLECEETFGIDIHDDSLELRTAQDLVDRIWSLIPESDRDDES